MISSAPVRPPRHSLPVANVLTVAAISLAWLAFRLERQRVRARDIAEALGTLNAVWHGMVEPRGLGFAFVPGWGNNYFAKDYEGELLVLREAETRRMIGERVPDQVFVVPTEPLARLASTSPSPGLITERTVSVANFALWKIGVFNQLAEKLTAWNVQHAAEIVDPETPPERRRVLEHAAARISHELHGYGVGGGWRKPTLGEQGWYRALVDSLLNNKHELQGVPKSRRRRGGSDTCGTASTRPSMRAC